MKALNLATKPEQGETEPGEDGEQDTTAGDTLEFSTVQLG